MAYSLCKPITTHVINKFVNNTSMCRKQYTSFRSIAKCVHWTSLQRFCEKLNDLSLLHRARKTVFALNQYFHTASGNVDVCSTIFFVRKFCLMKYVVFCWFSVIPKGMETAELINIACDVISWIYGLLAVWFLYFSIWFMNNSHYMMLTLGRPSKTRCYLIQDNVLSCFNMAPGFFQSK